jgi:hypothetical protein
MQKLNNPNILHFFLLPPPLFSSSLLASSFLSHGEAVSQAEAPAVGGVGGRGMKAGGAGGRALGVRRGTAWHRGRWWSRAKGEAAAADVDVGFE